MIDENNLDHALFTRLFQTHPKYAKKCAGRCISHWEVADANRGIRVVFVNKSTDTVSWRTMVKSYCRGSKLAAQKAHMKDLCKAFRCEVRDQIARFRTQAGLLNGVTHHVGHDYETGLRFIELLKAFIQLHSLQPSALQIVYRSNVLHELADRTLATLWRKYHQKHAVLRMETARANCQGNLGFKQEQWYY